MQAARHSIRDLSQACSLIKEVHRARPYRTPTPASACGDGTAKGTCSHPGRGRRSHQATTCQIEAR
eukprot:7016292-Alexandrium_andersonii.AAC.1